MVMLTYKEMAPMEILIEEAKKTANPTESILIQGMKIIDWIDNEDDPEEVDYIVNLIAGIFRENTKYRVAAEHLRTAELLLDDLLHLTCYDDDYKLFCKVYETVAGTATEYTYPIN